MRVADPLRGEPFKGEPFREKPLSLCPFVLIFIGVWLGYLLFVLVDDCWELNLLVGEVYASPF